MEFYFPEAALDRIEFLITVNEGRMPHSHAFWDDTRILPAMQSGLIRAGETTRNSFELTMRAQHALYLHMIGEAQTKASPELLANGKIMEMMNLDFLVVKGPYFQLTRLGVYYLLAVLEIAERDKVLILTPEGESRAKALISLQRGKGEKIAPDHRAWLLENGLAEENEEKALGFTPEGERIAFLSAIWQNLNGGVEFPYPKRPPLILKTLLDEKFIDVQTRRRTATQVRLGCPPPTKEGKFGSLTLFGRAQLYWQLTHFIPYVKGAEE